MANQFGIDMGQVYRTTESVKGSRQNRKMNSLNMDWAKEDRQRAAEQREAARQRTQQINALRARIAQGGEDAQAAERELIALDPESATAVQEPLSNLGERRQEQTLNALRETVAEGGEGSEAAERQLIAFAPDEAKQIQDAFAKMDERDRKQTEENIEQLGRMSIGILSADSEEDQAARYQRARANVHPDVAANMPEEYDPNWVEMQLARARELDDMLKNPELITIGGEDRLYKDGSEIESSTSNALLRAETDDDSGLKSSDENTIFRQAGELMGGIFDQDGNLQNLDPSTRSKVQSIATEAGNLFNSGQAETRAQAVTMAARKLGVKIEDVSEVQPGNSVTRMQYNPETGKVE